MMSEISNVMCFSLASLSIDVRIMFILIFDGGPKSSYSSDSACSFLESSSGSLRSICPISSSLMLNIFMKWVRTLWKARDLSFDVLDWLVV